MNKTLLPAVLLLALASCNGSDASGKQEEAHDPKREAYGKVMKSYAEASKFFKQNREAIARGEMREEVRKHAAKYAEGSENEDFLGYIDEAQFRTLAKSFSDNVKALTASLATFDATDFAAKLEAVNQSCTACHDVYKKEE